MNMTDEVHASHRLDEHAEALLEAAQAFQTAAGKPHSSANAPAALGRLEQALQALSASWCDVAADAAPAIVERWNLGSTEAPSSPADRGLSHEQEAHLMATLHDVAGAFARCARTCRDGQSVVAPLLADCPTGPLQEPDAPPLVAHAAPAAVA
jgi:hypothetical protein